MFRNTKEPSSGGEYLCLAKATCGSMVLVHVNSVSIVAAYMHAYHVDARYKHEEHDYASIR
jgi:hypothetical protein